MLRLSLSLTDAELRMFTAQMDAPPVKEKLNDGRRRFFRLRQAKQRLKNISPNNGLVDEIDEERHTGQFSESFVQLKSMED